MYTAFAVAFFVLHLNYKNHYSGIDYWAMSFVAHLLSIIFGILRVQTQNPIWSVVSNLFPLVGFWAIQYGIMHFHHKSIPSSHQRIFAVLGLVYTMVMSWQILADQPYFERILSYAIINSFFVGLLMLGWVTQLSELKKRMVLLYFSGFAFLILNLTRISHALLEQPIQMDTGSPTTATYLLLINIALTPFFAIGLFHLLNSKLALDLGRSIESLNTQVEQQAEQLLISEKMASLGLLASAVAHEINNPNQIIRFNIDLLENKFKCGMDQKTKKWINNIQTSSERIKFIASSLRNYSSQSSSLSQKVSLNSCIDSSIELIQTWRLQYCNHFKIVLSENLPSVHGQEAKIQQIIVNLVQNACLALEHAEQSIEIHTQYLIQTDKIRLTIKDQGPGANPDEIQNWLKPFFTTRASTGGSGLGLWIVQKLCDEMDAVLNISSTVGQGTQIEICFNRAS